MATQREVAEHLGVSQPVVAKLVSAGVFLPTGPRGGLDLDACRRAYLSRLREEAAGRAAHGGADGEEGELDLVAERARLAAAQADRIEMEIHRTAGLVVPIEECMRQMTAVLGKVRTRILAIPSEAAPSISRLKAPAEVEADLRRRVIEALTDLSSGKALAERTRAEDRRKKHPKL